MNTIDIVLASDQRYFPGLLVTVVSIAASACREYELNFNIQDGGICDEDFAFLQRRTSEVHPYVRFNRLNIDASKFDAFRSYHGSKMTYARMLLPEMLSDLEFVIYCDVDYLWMSDISELWAERDARVVCKGVRDEMCSDDEINFLCLRGYPVEKESYICAGLELLNLKLMREQRTSDAMFAFLKENPDNLLNDQSAINAVEAGRIGLLEQKWMVLSNRLLECDFPCAIHYATYGSSLIGLKVSNGKFVTDDAVLLWHRYYSAVMGIPLRQHLREFYRGTYLWHRLLFRVLSCKVLGRLFGSYVNEFRKPRARFKQPSVDVIANGVING